MNDESMGQLEQTTDEPDIETDVAPEKYIHVRQHPPQHFTGYSTKDLRLTKFADGVAGVLDGIKVSLGTWKRTGAEVIQKFLFETAKGWTPERVNAWFADNPQFYAGDDHLFVALSADPLDADVTYTLEMATALPLNDDAPLHILDVIVIQGGWGKNQRRSPDGTLSRDYFPKHFLESLLPLLDQTPVQAVKLTPLAPGDAPEMIQRIAAELKQYGHPEPLINQLLSRGLVGNVIGFLTQPVLEEVPTETGEPMFQIRARLLLADTDAAQEMRRLFRFAWQHGLSQALGLSINYRASVEFSQIDGVPACIFQMATSHISTEFVASPAAGGKIVGVVQGETFMADEMNKPQPSQGDAVLTNSTPAATPVDLPHVTQQEHPAKVEQTPVNAPASPAPAAKMEAQHSTQAAAPSGDVTRLEDLIAQVARTVSGLAADVVGIKQQAHRSSLTELVTQAELTDAAKTQILTKIATGDLTTTEQIQAMVAVAQANMPAPKADEVLPSFPGLNVQNIPRAQIMKDRKDVNKVRSYQMWGIPLTQAEQALAEKYRIRPFMGLKEEYISLTGDTETRFHGLDPRVFAQNIHPDCLQHSAYYRGTVDDWFGNDANYAQAILTSSYSDFLTHILNRTLEVHYAADDKSYMKMLKKGDPYNDNRDHTHFMLGQFPEMDVVTEGSSYTDIGSAGMEQVTSSSVKRGNLWILSEETIQDDDLEFVRNSIQQIARAANRTLKHQVLNKIIGYGTAFNDATMTDTIGGALYSSTNRKNYVNGSIENFDDVHSLINLMLVKEDYLDDDGTRAELELMPYLFIGNAIHIGKIHAMVRATDEPGRTDNLPNTLYFLKNLPDENFISVHPRYLLNHPEFLCILPNPQVNPGIMLKFFRGMETPEMIWEGNQSPAYGSAFGSDTLQLRVKMKYRLFYYDLTAFHGMYQA